MKKYFLTILLTIFVIGCHDDHHDHDDHDGHDHGDMKSSAPKVFSSDIEYLTNLNLIKGHLWVGVELYKANYIENGQHHMKHPESELYGDIIPTFEAKGTDGFSAELEKLALSVENEEPLNIIDDNYQNLFDAIDKNAQFVSEESKTVDQAIILVQSLLETAAEEYAIGIVDGDVKNKYEYQDALGFTMIAKDILNKMQVDENSESQIATESPTFSDNISSIDQQSSEDKLVALEDEKRSNITLPDEQMLIYFPANSSRVLGKTTIKKLKNIVGILLSEMDLQVLLEGHSSNDGDFSINLNLSRQRANIVRDFLIEEGIESNRISVKALGEQEPIFDNSTTTGRVLNRCVLINIK